MPLNVRHPRCWIEIGGVRIRCISASVQRRAKRESDTFSAQLSITETARYGFGLAEWTDFDPQDVSVIMSSALDGSDERVMITGQVDMPGVNLLDMTVAFRPGQVGLAHREAAPGEVREPEDRRTSSRRSPRTTSSPLRCSCPTRAASSPARVRPGHRAPRPEPDGLGGAGRPRRARGLPLVRRWQDALFRAGRPEQRHLQCGLVAAGTARRPTPSPTCSTSS
jgi:hypothetical protein